MASLLRCIVFDTEAGDEAWLHKLTSHGFCQDDIDSIISSVKVCSNWQVDNQGLIVPPEEREQYDISLGLAKTWHTNTWISQEGISNVMLTDQGSLAGTPFADLAYTFAMSRVLSVFRKSLAIVDPESHIHVNGTQHKVEDVSFVDDVTVLIVDNADGIIEKVCAVTTVAVNAFAGFGMDLDFSAGKSECVVEFVGKGKKHATNSMHNNGNAIDIIIINNVKTINLKFPKLYKYVGTALERV